MIQELQVTDPAQLGLYRLLGVLGGNRLGKVYLGVAASGLAAVRVMDPGLTLHPQFAARFAHVVAAARQVRGPGIAAVVDADPWAPLPWMATEYVRGVPLDRAVQATGPLPAASVHVLATGLAHALAAIHAAGLVHRDITPSNVLLAADRPFLVDFGTTQALDATQLSAAGAMVGTAAFLSPEQAEGFAAEPPSDVFALGAVLTYAALGRGPFGDTNPMAVLRRIVDDPADLRGLDGPSSALIDACLAKRPPERPTAADLAARLGPFPATPPGAAVGGWLPAAVMGMIPPPPDIPAMLGRTVRGRRPVRRRALLTGVAATLGLAAAGGGIATAVTLGSRSTSTAAAPPAPTTPPTPAPSALPPPPGTATARWTVSVPISISAIAADGDTVYAGGDGGVVALDRATGAQRWQYTAPETGGPDRAHLEAAEGTVYVDTRGGLSALDAVTGNERWRVMARSADGFWTVTPGPGAVYAPDDRDLIALDAMTGTERWRHAVAGRFVNAFTTDGDQVFVSDASTVDALDAATGESRWQHRGGEDTGQTLTVADATVFVGNRGALVALDAASGAVRWEVSLDADRAAGQPVVADGALVFIAGDEQLIALETATGAIRWDATDGEIVQVGPAASAEPGGQFVYAAAESGRVIAVEAATGARHWAYPAPVSHTWLKALAADDGTAFIGTTDEVSALGPA